MQPVVDNYLVKKLGLSGDNLIDSIAAVMDKYSKSERAKYCAIIEYMLCVHHKKESVYN